MSVSVELAELQDRIAEYGPIAYLMTVGDDSRPHLVAVSVSVSVDGGDVVVVVGAGRTTLANATAHPAVSLLWPARPGEAYCLIVDAAAAASADVAQLRLTPTRAVLHRTPAGDPAEPSCITVL